MNLPSASESGDWSSTPLPSLACTLVWKSCCSRPEDQPTGRTNGQTNFFLNPETLGRLRLTCQKSRKRVRAFFRRVSSRSSFFFIRRPFSTVGGGLIESEVQRGRRRRRQTECHQHFVVRTNCRRCYVSLLYSPHPHCRSL